MVELFPTAVLDTSILTAVLVGLLLVWLLQEWLGWGFTGLVVPGYLASVVAIQPLTGAVMVVEGIATWLVIVALSDALPRWWPWSPLFGRDRFFLALLGSVGVRLAMEGAVFPWLGERFELRIANELHSMGLVVVPLLAYAIWRNGPVRAVPRLGVPLLLTWAFLEHVLLAGTNLSLASFELTYEDLAVDFVSSPRAYILLLCGAWLGSVTNLRYGWDFGGIIVPGLLALCWLQPERLAATVGESLVIAVALQLVLRLPALREMNLAGGRTLILAMLLGYALKFGLGHLLGAGWPGLRLRQLFGFGYLLPALMALRIVRSGDPFRTIVPALATSLAGFGGGTALAFLLALALPVAPSAPPERADPVAGDEDLLLAAWADEGGAPADLDARLAAGQAALVQAGDGFGALWLRAEGRPLVISARVGEGPQAQAALGLARLLDARGVHLCGPRGAACEEARRRVGLRIPTVILELGPEPGLVAGGQVAQALPVEALGPVLGAVPVYSGEGASTLTLSPAQAWRLAAWKATRGPEGWEHPLARGLQAPEGPQEPGGQAGARGVLRHEVVGALLRWSQGGEEAADALVAATVAAGSLGATVHVDGPAPTVAAVRGPDWRVVVRAGAAPLILVVPRAEDDPHAAAFALGLAQAWDAALVVLDSPPLWANAEPRVERLAHAALLGGLEALGPAVEVIDLRGLRDLQDAQADAILSLGRPMLAGFAEPAWIQERREGLHDLGLGARWFDGAPERLSFRDGANPGRLATQAATGQERHATLFLSSQARARATPLDPDGALLAALDASSLPLWSAPLGSVAAAVQAGPPPRGADPWAAWARSAAALRSTSPAPRAVAALQDQARRAGGRAGLLCEPLAGCRWLAALRCAAGTCDGVVVPLGQGGPVAPRAPAATHLLFGDQPLRLSGLAAPAEGPP